jgi:thiol-disulfide isomerase/thioredoxin
MKNPLLLILSIGLFLSSIAQSVSKPRFFLSGKISAEEGKNIYLNYISFEGKSIKDSCRIENGEFHFSGLVSTPVVATLMKLNLQKWRYSDTNIVQFFIEPTTMVAQFIDDKFTQINITGSASQLDYASLCFERNKIKSKIGSVLTEYESLRNSGDIKDENILFRMDSLAKIINKNDTELLACDTGFFNKNPLSVVTTFELRYYLNRLPYAVLANYYSNMSLMQRDSRYGKFLFNEISSLKNGQAGEYAYNFNAKDINGRVLTLSSLKGKYIVLVFWASWCVPCRAENPELEALFNKFKHSGRGIDFVGISDDKKQERAWRLAVKKDGITAWKHLLNSPETSGKANSTVDLFNRFGINKIPVKILVDPAGKIIGRFEAEGNKELINQLNLIHSSN